MPAPDEQLPSLWRHPDFLRLWGGESISVFGSQISQLAIPLVAIKVLNASTFEVGLLNAVELAPFLLVGLFAGVWVDRWRRRPVLIVSDIGRTVALVSLPIAYWVGALSLLQLYIVALCTGVLTVFFDVAYQSYLPSLIDRRLLPEGNGKLQISESAAQVAGPGVAGALIGLLGAAVAVLFDAVSFLVSALAVSLIRSKEPDPERPAEGDVRPRMRSQIAEGLRFVLGNRLLWSMAGCTGTSNLGSGAFYAVFLVYAVRTLHLSSGTIGLIFAAGNVGFLIGAVISSRVVARIGLGQTILWSILVSGLGGLLIPLAPKGGPIPLLIAGQFVLSFGIPIYNSNTVSLRQAIAPTHIQGRMNATMRFIVWGTIPIGSLIGGVLGGSVGLRTTIWIGASVQAMAFVWVLFSPVFRLREIPAPVDGGDDDDEDAVLLPVEAALPAAPAVPRPEE
jgi:MFS family permease